MQSKKFLSLVKLFQKERSMRQLTPKLITILVATFLVLAGCDKKGTTEPTDQKPSIPQFQLSLPSSSALSDTCNARAFEYASIVTGYATEAAGIAALPLINNNGVWSLSIPDSGQTHTISATRQSDGSYLWKYLINPGNWTLIDGMTTSIDGTTGNLTVYDDSNAPAQVIFLKVSWKPVTGGVELTLDMYESGQPSGRVVVVSGTSGSGDITEYARSGSQWLPTGGHWHWNGANAVATCL